MKSEKEIIEIAYQVCSQVIKDVSRKEDGKFCVVDFEKIMALSLAFYAHTLYQNGETPEQISDMFLYIADKAEDYADKIIENGKMYEFVKEFIKTNKEK
jgi:hypothetical protein